MNMEEGRFTAYFKMEKCGRGYRATEARVIEGLKLWGDTLSESTQKVVLQEPIPYNDMKVLLRDACKSDRIATMPYVCDLVEGGELYQTIFVCNNAKQLKNRPQKRDNCGTLVPRFDWLDEIPAEELASLM